MPDACYGRVLAPHAVSSGHRLGVGLLWQDLVLPGVVGDKACDGVLTTNLAFALLVADYIRLPLCPSNRYDA